MKKIVLFLKNVATLTLTSLIMRSIGVAFGAYLNRKIGAGGMGLYSLILSVYTFAVTFATSGINLAVTQTVAGALGRGRIADARRAMKTAVIFSLCFGIGASVLLFCTAEFCGTVWLGDERTVSSLKLLSVTLAPIALGTVFNGYFTAVRRVEKSAIIAMVEQIVKIGLTIFLLTSLAEKGLEFACLAMVGGSCIAEAASLLLSLVFYRLDSRKYLVGNGAHHRSYYGRQVVRVALPLAVTSYVRTGLVTLEHILIPKGLEKFGAGKAAALASYGVIHGMVFPVIFFPTAFLGAFAGLIIPEMAERKAQGDTAGIARLANRLMGATLFFSVGCGGILTCFAGAIGQSLYGNDEACRYLRIFAALIPVMYLDTMVDCMLKGLGAQVSCMRINLLDAALCVAAVWLLLPRFGIDAYVWIVFGSEILNIALSISRLSTLTTLRVALWRWCFAPLIAVTGATVLCMQVKRILPTVLLLPTLQICLGILFCCILYYLLFCLLCGAKTNGLFFLMDTKKSSPHTQKGVQ